MALSVLQVFKRLPGTNCRDCGAATCLAFATRVIKEGEDLTRCPHLSADAGEIAEELRRQQDAGVGRRRESVAIAAEVMHAKVESLNFAALAPGLGVDAGVEEGRPFLLIPYFGTPVKVFKDQTVYPPGTPEDPWDAILLYNYLAFQGNQPLTDRWITFKELPNSVSKVKTLTRLEKKLAAAFAGRQADLRRRGRALNGEAPTEATQADVALVFRPLPRIPLMLLFWDAEAGESFEATARFLFDSQVSAYLDLESLLFVVEKLLDRLLD